jgi:Raf kinase inhibitor-like YbhB/YbcL family protein
MLSALFLSAALTLSTGALDSQGAQFSWRYTCYNVREPSPPVSWTGVPDGSQTLVLVLDAPDRPLGIGTHWLIFNIPPQLGGLPENIPKDAHLDSGAVQGRNDTGSIGYTAPCPPVLTSFTYQFTLYALDTVLTLGPDATSDAVLNAATGHILDQTQVSGPYLRPAWPWG